MMAAPSSDKDDRCKRRAGAPMGRTVPIHELKRADGGMSLRSNDLHRHWQGTIPCRASRQHAMPSRYIRGIWASRYFWTHLSLADLRSRWRRSFFGVLWTIIQPLGLTLLLSVVFGRIFNTSIVEYAPYILSGMVVWEFVSASSINGSLSFVQADAYIKQCQHPLAIYTLRTVLTNLIVLLLASSSLIAWVLIVMPQKLRLGMAGGVNAVSHSGLDRLAPCNAPRLYRHAIS